MTKIERISAVTSSITATAVAATSPKIQFGAAAGGAIIVDSVGGGAATITWHIAFGPEDAPRPLNSGGSGVTTDIAASNAYALPDALYGAPFVVAVTDTGTATIRVSLKG